jgi:hypothetical protein
MLMNSSLAGAMSFTPLAAASSSAFSTAESLVCPSRESFRNVFSYYIFAISGESSLLLAIVLIAYSGLLRMYSSAP